MLMMVIKSNIVIYPLITSYSRGVWLLLLAIGSHKFIIALCLGQQLVTSKVGVAYWSLILMWLILLGPLGSDCPLHIHLFPHNSYWCWGWNGHAALSQYRGGRPLSQCHRHAGNCYRVPVVRCILWGEFSWYLCWPFLIIVQVIEKERATKTSQLLQLVFILLGSSTIIMLKV